MLDTKPEKYIPECEINNLDYYASGFGGYELVNKYVRNILSNWILSLDNPLAIDWVQFLLQSNMDQVESRLSQYEKQIGEENLIALLAELGNEGGNAPGILQKIESLQGEIIAYQLLENIGHKNIFKIKNFGDWESDSSLISVKSLLDLDIQYQYIEKIIQGLIYVEENSVLLNYDNIFLFDKKDLNYQFLTNIIVFIQSSFVNIIKFIDREYNHSDYLHINFCKHKTNHMEQNLGLFQVEVRKYRNQPDKTIVFEIKYKSSKKGDHHLKIRLKKEPEVQNNYFYIHYDSNTYFKENFDYSKIQRNINLKIQSLDSSFKKCSSKKEFIGWINISISPKHESFTLDNIDMIKEKLSTWYGNRPYKIIICLHPQWGFDLRKPVFFELTKD